MNKIITFAVWLLCMQTNAQDLMRITTSDGKHWNFSINNIDEVKFSISKQLDVVGEWLSIYEDDVVTDQSYLYRIIFNNDGSYSSCLYYTPIYDNHFVNLTEVKGTYTVNNNNITIKRSDGQTELYEVIGFSDSFIESAAGDYFHKVQTPLYKMTTTDAPISIGDAGDIIKIADNYFTTIEDNKIKSYTSGTGYALVEDSETKALKAYRIDIEYVMPPMMDWTQYYNASSDKIKELFGDYDFKNEANTWVYMRYDAAIQSVEFTFTEDFQEVKEIEVNFYDNDKRQPYFESIISNYTLYNTTGGVKMYINPNRPNEVIYVNTSEHNYRIIYNCAYNN